MNLKSLEERYGRAFTPDERIDLICDDFEREFLAGRQPCIDDFVVAVDESLREGLYRELLLIAFDYRMQRAPDPERDETLDQLDDDNDRVHEVCSQFQARADAAVEPPRRTGIAHYVLLDKIGSGGHGTVWRAKDTRLDRSVAVKISRGRAESIVEEEHFLREAQAAAQLSHPSIISVHEVGRDGEETYIVSDYIAGPSLKDWSRSERPPASDAAELCRKLALAVHYAHSQQVIHRDLKPGNILIDAAGEPHITDFGLAKRLSHETARTLEGQLLGTPAYMSPEQAAGRSHQVDGRTDIYSLGVILYELLTGRVPFEGDFTKVLQQVVSADPPIPTSINRQIPRALECICLKAMAKLPADRYATAEEFAADLARFLAGDPVSAQAPNFVERAWRRFRKVSLSAPRAAFLALLVPVAGVLSWTGTRHTAAPPLRSTPAAMLTRTTHLTTVPAGARVAIVPIDEESGLPIATRVIRPAQRTPLAVALPPASYLVVAEVPGHGFHEVYRSVPRPGVRVPGSSRSSAWRELPDGAIELPTIEIPEESEVTAGLACFRGGPFMMGDARWPMLAPHSRDVADFYLAPTEVTIGEYRRQFEFLPTDFKKAGIPEDDANPIVFISFRQALDYAERVGLRLPTEAEYEYAATAGGTREFPWGDDAERITGWDFGPAGRPAFDQTPTEPPVFGLYSNVAEWTDSRATAYPNAVPTPARRISKLPTEFNQMTMEARAVRGGPYSVAERLPEGGELRYGPRWRHGVTQDSQHGGLGFRCARSAKPRFLD